MGERVRAKFRVFKKLDQGHCVELQMAPVYSDDPTSENRRFWDATPAGSLTMYISNKPAADLFVEGKEYFLEFTEA